MRTLKAYTVEGYQGLFVVLAFTRRDAYSEGVSEFGRGMVKRCEPSSVDEVELYFNQRDIDVATLSKN